VTYLLDSNIWLEAIVDRAHADEVTQLLRTAPAGTLAATDYAVHSVGLYLYREKPDAFREFLDDLVRLRLNSTCLRPACTEFCRRYPRIHWISTTPFNMSLLSAMISRSSASTPTSTEPREAERPPSQVLAEIGAV
jgi:hypothetical protein